jgi:hypothetical protein
LEKLPHLAPAEMLPCLERQPTPRLSVRDTADSGAAGPIHILPARRRNRHCPAPARLRVFHRALQPAQDSTAQVMVRHVQRMADYLRQAIVGGVRQQRKRVPQELGQPTRHVSFQHWSEEDLHDTFRPSRAAKQSGHTPCRLGLGGAVDCRF